MNYFREWLAKANSKQQLYKEDHSKPWFFVEDYEEEKRKFT